MKFKTRFLSTKSYSLKVFFALLIVNGFFCWMDHSFPLMMLKIFLNSLFSLQEILKLLKFLFCQKIWRKIAKKAHLFHGLYRNISAELHSKQV